MTNTAGIDARNTAIVRRIEAAPYVVTIFLSAALLFLVQPMIARMIHPWFGSSASAWLVCMIFFQTTLLAGYFYAHIVATRIRPDRQPLCHIAVLLASLFFLPLAPAASWAAEGPGEPFSALLRLLLTTAGVPFFVLSTTTPLVQAWYGRRFGTPLPTKLFACSNLASLLALLAYPFAIEPRTTLSLQSKGWSVLFAAFACGTAVLCIVMRRTAGRAINIAADGELHDVAAVPALSDRGTWFGLSACASFLLFSVTNHLTKSVASVPLLWVLPLSAYLLTFVLSFNMSGIYRSRWYAWPFILSVAVMLYGLGFWDAAASFALVTTVYCVGLFVCCMICHGELVMRAPAAADSTVFYLCISAGGAFGGLLVGIAAPLVLNGYYEPFAGLLAISAAGALLYRRSSPLAAVACCLLACAVLYAGGVFYRNNSRNAISQKRNFYGCLKVEERGSGRRFPVRKLIFNATVHGGQFTAPALVLKPLTYYSELSGAGIAVRTLQRKGPLKVGAIGLGAGTLAAYGRPEDRYRFYEINADVIGVADKYFSYLTASPSAIEIMLGDGRFLLAGERPQEYDLLVVDAFTGDVVPLHLITKEAVRLYLKHIRQGGVIAVHVTNAHLDFAPIVARLCRELGVGWMLLRTGPQGVVADDGVRRMAFRTNELSGEFDAGYLYPSDWLLISSHPVVDISMSPTESTIVTDGAPLWTDDRHSILDALVW